MDREDLAQRLIPRLREALGSPQLGYADPPVPLARGGEAQVYAFSLSGAPERARGPLVVRCLEPRIRPEQALFEAAVHEGLETLGYPAPRVVLACADAAAIGAPFLVMTRLPGRILLEEVTRPAELLRRPLRVPGLVREALVGVPRRLGELQAWLHDLDPEPVCAALRAAGFDEAEFTGAGRLERLRESCAEGGLAELEPALAWLTRERPRREGQVICHGDFVFTNFVVERGRVTGILDWSTVAIADPGYDVAGTVARLSSTVSGVPAALGLVFRTVQRNMRRRYLAEYRRRRRLDADALRYYEVFFITRELALSARRLAGGEHPGPDVVDRWLYPEARAAGRERIRALSGVRLDPAPSKAAGAFGR